MSHEGVERVVSDRSYEGSKEVERVVSDRAYEGPKDIKETNEEIGFQNIMGSNGVSKRVVYYKREDLDIKPSRLKNFITKLENNQTNSKIAYEVSDQVVNDRSVGVVGNEEPLLKPTLDRFTIFPIKYTDIWDIYKKHEALFWLAEDINYNADLESWDKLNEQEKYFIEHILAFFAGADGIVLENLMSNFSQEVQVAEARYFYGAQAYIEQVHSQTYSQLIETYIKDPVKKESLFKAIETIPCVRKKAEWALKWMDSKKNPFSERLIAFIVVEGIFFSGAFCAIFWLKHRGLMTKTLGFSNEYIARDEGLHATFGVLMYSYIKNKVSQERIYEIFKEAVEIEQEFIIESLPCKLIGMNSSMMTDYIKYVADYWIHNLGYTKIYNKQNPFSFMIMSELDGKSNFFDRKVSEYRRASTTIDQTSNGQFKISEDF